MLAASRSSAFVMACGSHVVPIGVSASGHGGRHCWFRGIDICFVGAVRADREPLSATDWHCSLPVGHRACCRLLPGLSLNSRRPGPGGTRALRVRGTVPPRGSALHASDINLMNSSAGGSSTPVSMPSHRSTFTKERHVSGRKTADGTVPPRDKRRLRALRRSGLPGVGGDRLDEVRPRLVNHSREAPAGRCMCRSRVPVPAPATARRSRCLAPWTRRSSPECAPSTDLRFAGSVRRRDLHAPPVRPGRALLIRASHAEEHGVLIERHAPGRIDREVVNRPRSRNLYFTALIGGAAAVCGAGPRRRCRGRGLGG